MTEKTLGWHIEDYRKSLDVQCKCGYSQQADNEINFKYIETKR